MSTLNYNKKYFPNIEWAASKSLVEFIEHEKHTGLTDDELKEAHELCVAAVAPVVVPIAEAATGRKGKEPKVTDN